MLSQPAIPVRIKSTKEITIGICQANTLSPWIDIPAEVLLVEGVLEAEAFKYFKLHDLSRDSTAPAVLVTAIVGQVNFGWDCVIVVVIVLVDVLVSVMVKLPVPVQEEVCRANSAFLKEKVERPGPK